jgi:hypothetical protein
MSFLPEGNREFFGDWQCNGGDYYKKADFVHGPTWHWGFRHWMWMLMGAALFIYNAVIMIIKLDKES